MDERTMGVRGYKPLAPLTDAEERKGVSDVLVACFEGGSNYWIAEAVSIPHPRPEGAVYASDVPSAGGVVIVTEDRSEEGKPDVRHRLTYAKMLNGCKDAAEFTGKSLRAYFDDHDAGTADLALQFALLGEEVYG